MAGGSVRIRPSAHLKHSGNLAAKVLALQARYRGFESHPEYNMNNISGDMYYVKAIYRNRFIDEKTEHVKIEWSGENKWEKYPKFLRYRVCDYSGEPFQLDDQVFCVYVIKLK